MREIKFRAFYKDENKKPRMVHFNELYYCDEYNHLSFELNPNDRNPNGPGFGNLGASIEDFSDIMQFCGLRDKNGKEIYEGDLVIFGVWKPGKWAIGWNGDSAKFDLVWVGEGEKSFLDLCDEYGEVPSDLKVIGNVCENGDLLK